MTADLGRRLGVLIDAENIPAAHAEEVFRRLAALGTATVRRAYGDFTAAALRGWVAALPEAAIEARQVFPNSHGKDAADMALIVDAMDLLHAGRLDGFCLVSSDSDFTRLATRIREEGLPVYGFGRANAAVAYRNACTTFIPIGQAMAVVPAIPKKPTTPGGADSNPVQLLVRQVLSTTDWLPLSEVGNRLRKVKPDFTQRDTGHATLSKLLQSYDFVEVSTQRTTAAARLKKRKAA